jgi:hypothetical protein
MKKTYMAPIAIVVEINARSWLMTVSAGDKGIGYGGVNDGSHTPSSRRCNNWDDDGEND